MLELYVVSLSDPRFCLSWVASLFLVFFFFFFFSAFDFTYLDARVFDVPLAQDAVQLHVSASCLGSVHGFVQRSAFCLRCCCLSCTGLELFLFGGLFVRACVHSCSVYVVENDTIYILHVAFCMDVCTVCVHEMYVCLHICVCMCLLRLFLLMVSVAKVANFALRIHRAQLMDGDQVSSLPPTASSPRSVLLCHRIP